MARIQPVTPENATGKTKEIYDGLQSKMGKVINIFQGMGNSPAVLQAYLGISGALQESSLSAQVREQIALAVAQENDCGYCLAAHTVIGKGAGLTEEQTVASRQGKGTDEKAEAAITFAKAVLNKKGLVTNDDVETFKAAGYEDAQVAEVVAVVVQNIFTNYFNHVAETEVDFPAAPELTTA